MKIEELIKDLDPISIIEFKNYLLEHLTELCCKKDSNSIVISSHRREDLFCEKCGCKFYKNGKTKTPNKEPAAAPSVPVRGNFPISEDNCKPPTIWAIKSYEDAPIPNNTAT